MPNEPDHTNGNGEPQPLGSALVQGDDLHDGLNHRQRLFVYHYLNDGTGNARDAAEKAGYGSPRVTGPKLARMPLVKAALAQNVKDAGLSIPEIAARLAEQATASIGDFVTIEANGLPRIDLTRARAQGKLHLVHSLTPTKHGWGIKLHDQQAALVHLGRAAGMFVDRIALSRDFDPSTMTTEELKAIAEGKA